MSQVSNYAIADGDGITVLAALNALFGAIQSVNSGASAPASPVSGMPWLDTSTTPPTRRRRNPANSGWDLDDLLAVGLGATTITALTDVSNLTVPGFYYASSGATGLPAITSAYADIHLAAPTTNGGINVAFALASNRMFVQRKSGGTWQAWVELPTGATATGLSVLQAASGPLARTAIGAYGATDLAVAADITAGTVGALLDAAVFTANKLILGTSQVTTRGTSKDFTGIPAWAKRVKVMLNGVSTNGSPDIIVQLGVGSSPTTAGYAAFSQTGSTGGSLTRGFAVSQSTSAATAKTGCIELVHMGGNIWGESGIVAGSNSIVSVSAGSLALGGVLGMIRLTTVNGTDTFDAGSLNITWE